MHFNTFLWEYGLDPEDFENIPVEPTETDTMVIYYLTQVLRTRTCDKCACKSSLIFHDRRSGTIDGGMRDGKKVLFVILKIRVKCKECGAVYTVPLNRVHPYARRTDLMEKRIANECKQFVSFSTIAKKYGVSTNTVINQFKKTIVQVKRGNLPEILCIDEIYFKNAPDKFITVLYDFETGDIVDLINYHTIEGLNKYFMNIPEGERKRVKVFISDMYAGFAYVREQWFPKAVHCIDYFHMIWQFQQVIKKMRYRVQNINATSHPNHADFMKHHAMLFIKNEFQLKDYLTTLADGSEVSSLFMITECLKLDQQLWDAYRAYQELIQYTKYSSFEDAYNFINRIADKLLLSQVDLVNNVGRTYKRWAAPIAQGMIGRAGGKRFNNSVAEGNNSLIKRIINISFCYDDFETLRKRVLLIKRELKKNK